MPTILAVDDSNIQLRLVAKVCSETCPDAQLLTSESAERCLETLPEISDIALAIIDQNMEGITGLELIKTLKERGVPPKRMILCTANGQETIIAKARELGASFIKKPVDAPMLTSLFKNILKNQRK